MKITFSFWMLLTLALGSQALACPNFTGKFHTLEYPTIVYTLVQNGCETLSVTDGGGFHFQLVTDARFRTGNESQLMGQSAWFAPFALFVNGVHADVGKDGMFNGLGSTFVTVENEDLWNMKVTWENRKLDGTIENQNVFHLKRM